MLSIITVLYNSQNDLKKYIESLLDSYENKELIELIFIDNGDECNEYEQIFSKISTANIEFSYYRMGYNSGFSVACNKGVTIAKYEHVAFVNPDIEFIKLGLRNITKCASWSYVNSIGRNNENNALDILPNKMIVKYFFPLNIKWPNIFCRYLYRKELEAVRNNSFISDLYVVGSFLIVNKDKFLSIGGFDTNFFMYLEDADLSIRLYEAFGDPMRLNEIEVCHRAMGSTSSLSRAFKMKTESLIYYIKKYRAYVLYLEVVNNKLLGWIR